MTEEWRTLLYPLGFLSAVAFGGRFVVQWLYSELVGQSSVPKLFWRISIIGNLLLWSHALIQFQFHVAVVQCLNSVISWRNCNLMRTRDTHWRFHNVLLLMFVSLAATVCFFWIMGDHSSWFRIPSAPWNDTHTLSVSVWWHAAGTLGLLLFGARFWVQWWRSEQAGRSIVGLSFWWMSLAGALLQLGYFAQIKDPVNLVGPVFGMIPYLRNLALMRRSHALS